LLGSVLIPFLKIGVTIEIFKMSGKTPVVKERLTRSEKICAMEEIEHLTNFD
jgi:hypothetical protein